MPGRPAQSEFKGDGLVVVPIYLAGGTGRTREPSCPQQSILKRVQREDSPGPTTLLPCPDIILPPEPTSSAATEWPRVGETLERPARKKKRELGWL